MPLLYPLRCYPFCRTRRQRKPPQPALPLCILIPPLSRPSKSPEKTAPVIEAALVVLSGIRARSVHTAFFPLLREPPTADGRIWLKMFVSLNRDGEDLAEDAITDSVERLLGAQRRRGESNSGYTSQTSAGPSVGDTNRSISDVAGNSPQTHPRAANAKNPCNSDRCRGEI